MAVTVTPPFRSSQLARGLDVLRAFRQARESQLTLTQLANLVGLPKSTVLRLTRELVAADLLRRNGKTYSLALTMFELGHRVAVPAALREAALPFMQDLYEQTHLVVHLAVRDGSDVVVVERLRGRGAYELPSALGVRLPLHLTALGKAMMAFSPPEDVRNLLASPQSRRPGLERGHLMAELADARRTGVAYDHEGYLRGLRCAAAPIVDEHGWAGGAMSVSAYNRRSFDARRLGGHVRGAAAMASREARVRPAW